jgi:CheY-like chemotaxis protein
VSEILIVDDDTVDRQLAIRSLRTLTGLATRECADGQEALDSIVQEAPDLVLTDLRMPRLDGLALVEALREDHPDIPVLLMTSQGSEQIAVKALQAGAAGYIPKAELKRDLAGIVQSVLELLEARSSRREVLRYLDSREANFELVNEPALIPALVAFLQESLERIGFGTPSQRIQIGVALVEALSNAMIHGNLEVGSELRRTDPEANSALIRSRAGETPYERRRVRCTAVESPAAIRYTVADEGPGFDPSHLPDPTAPENLLGVSGRGVMLMRTFMDEVRYNDTGNQVTLIKQNAAVQP